MENLLAQRVLEENLGSGCLEHALPKGAGSYPTHNLLAQMALEENIGSGCPEHALPKVGKSEVWKSEVGKS